MQFTNLGEHHLLGRRRILIIAHPREELAEGPKHDAKPRQSRQEPKPLSGRPLQQLPDERVLLSCHVLVQPSCSDKKPLPAHVRIGCTETSFVNWEMHLVCQTADVEINCSRLPFQVNRAAGTAESKTGFDAISGPAVARDGSCYTTGCRSCNESRPGLATPARPDPATVLWPPGGVRTCHGDALHGSVSRVDQTQPARARLRQGVAFS